MSDPKRLLDGAGDDIEVALLSAGRDEQPSARAVEKTLLAIGAGGAAATGSAAATAAAELATGGAAAAGTAKAATAAATAAKAATAGAAVAPMAAKASVPVLIAWTGVAAAGGLGTLTAIDYLSEPSQPAPVTAPAAGSAAAERGPLPHQDAPAPRGIAPEADDEAPSAKDGDEATVHDRGDEAGEVAQASSAEPQANAGGADAVRKRRLADEVATLDRARSAIAAADGPGALAALDQYEATFETKMLGPEARTMRIEALLLAGRGGQARAVAARFLADHPSSTHARRIRSLLEARSPASPAQP